MILNVNKQEVVELLNLIDDAQYEPVLSHLREKLKRLQITSETVKSTIEQVQAAE